MSEQMAGGASGATGADGDGGSGDGGGGNSGGGGTDGGSGRGGGMMHDGENIATAAHVVDARHGNLLVLVRDVQRGVVVSTAIDLLRVAHDIATVAAHHER